MTSGQINGGLKASDILSHAEIRSLRRQSNLKGAWVVAHAWSVVAITMALYALYPGWLTLILGIFLIAGRQLGMAVLMHDASHGLLFQDRKLNDRIGQWLCGAPVGGDLYAYRPYHMKHHRRTQQADDPDLGLSAAFPITRWSLLRKIVRDLAGWTFVRNKLFLLRVALGESDGSAGDRLIRLWRTLGTWIASNLIMAAGFALSGRIDLYLLLWLLPLATTYQLVMRIRNIAEHAMVMSNDNPLQNSRTTTAGWLERAFLAPYWVNYHVEHHLWVWVPCFNLRRAHRTLRDKSLHPRMEIRQGYAEVLALATSA